jgi:hypothetical protein
MSPQTSLRILLLLIAFFAIALFVVYRAQQEYDAVTIGNLEYQLEMEKKIQEAELILGEKIDERTPMEKGKDLIDADLKKYGAIQTETAKKLIDMANEDIRRRSGLPPNK